MSTKNRSSGISPFLLNPPKGGVYTPVKQVGNLLCVSGQGRVLDEEMKFAGKVDGEHTVEEAQVAVRICILNTLPLLVRQIGDLNRAKNVVKLLGLVSSAAGFNRQPEVKNGASQLLFDLFGERGWHARSAIGANELSCNITVDIESIFEI